MNCLVFGPPLLLACLIGCVHPFKDAPNALAGNTILAASATPTDPLQYQDIVIKISDHLSKNNCQIFLTNLEKILSNTSQYLYEALYKKIKFGTIKIQLPSSWTAECLPSKKLKSSQSFLFNESINRSQGDLSDITIIPNLINKQYIWTQQTKGCGFKGDQIYIDYHYILNNRISEILREWTKYKFGVFDESGYPDDPVYPECKLVPDHYKPMSNDYYCSNETLSLMMNTNAKEYCGQKTHNSYTPTKQNFICQRKSISDVIMNSLPAIAKQNGSQSKNTPIKFMYEYNAVTRYMLILDNTQDILIRESWSYLRTAIRKWILDDLASNTEIGIILSSYNSTLITNLGVNLKLSGITPMIPSTLNYSDNNNKYLDIMSLKNQQNRDTLASFLPYTPNDYSNIKTNSNLNINNDNIICLECSIRKAINVLKQYEIANGLANTILLIVSPGMTYNININSLQTLCIENKYKINTINYPHIIRQQPLDILTTINDATVPGWQSYTVYESKENSDNTYLTTYFELTNILQHISYINYQGNKLNRPIEVHRKIFYDNSNLGEDMSMNNKTVDKPQIKSGSFLVDSSLTQPSSFFIYTHNNEKPLLRDIKLISPKGLIYTQRSDSRLALKQLTIISMLNETGTWHYEFERFYGNPQPHYVQVMATPNPYNYNNFIESNGRVDPLPNGGFIIIVEVMMGGESSKKQILSAQVDVIITHYDKCSHTNNIGMVIQETITASTSILNDKCQIKLSLLDNGNGNSDLLQKDGIYTRYFSPINTKIGDNNTHTTNTGVFRFDLIVTGNQAYTIDYDNIEADLDYLLDPNEDLPIPSCCGSYVPITKKKTINPFQRYLPPITKFVTKQIIEKEYNNSQVNENQYGRIGDLKAYILDGLKVRLTWSSPDIMGKQVVRYDIKYSLSISDLLDNYDSAALFWYHSTPLPYEIGDETTFILNISSTQLLVGETVFLAIRPYTELSHNAVKGAISNWVKFLVPKPIMTKFDTGDQRDDQYNKNDNNVQVTNKPVNNNATLNNAPGKRLFEKLVNTESIIAVFFICLIIVFLILLLIYCCFCVIRKNKRKQLNNKECDSHNENISTITNNNYNIGNDKTCSSSKYVDQQQNDYSKKLNNEELYYEYDYQEHDQQTYLKSEDSQEFSHSQYQISSETHQNKYHLLLQDPQIHGLPIYSSHVVVADNENYSLPENRILQREIHSQNDDFLPMQQNVFVNQMYPQQHNDDICSITTITANTPIIHKAPSQNYFHNYIPQQSTMQLYKQEEELNNYFLNLNLSPYQSWTASQLLGEHERRQSPNIFHNMNDDIHQSQSQKPTLNPPIPPLPYISDILDCSAIDDSLTNITENTVQNRVSEGMGQSSVNTLLTDNITYGDESNSYHTENYNKRKRNITMV